MIYIVTKTSGDYDTYTEVPIAASLELAKAEAFRDECERSEFDNLEIWKKLYECQRAVYRNSPMVYEKMPSLNLPKDKKTWTDAQRSEKKQYDLQVSKIVAINQTRSEQWVEAFKQTQLDYLSQLEIPQHRHQWYLDNQRGDQASFDVQEIDQL
jgi:hypothetical protein